MNEMYLTAKKYQQGKNRRLCYSRAFFIGGERYGFSNAGIFP